MENDTEIYPENLLEEMDPRLLAIAYIAETVYGDFYPPSTLQSLLSGILHYLRNVDESKAPCKYLWKE